MSASDASVDVPVALITAASRGMGAACARHLAAEGYRVALLSSSDGAIALADELGGLGLQGSVTEDDDLKALVDAAMERWGHIDGVVNNTGHPPKGPLLELTDDDWHRGLDLLVLNVVRMARHVVPHMQRQGGGSLVNISTFAAFEPSLAFPISAALRASLAGFTKLFADQHAADGIRMNNVLPGFIDSYPESPDIVAKIPMGRYGQVEEIARTVGFLLSDQASYITGQNLRVDGGITRSV